MLLCILKINIREILNTKIEVSLDILEKLNKLLSKQKNPLYSFYEEVKINMIKILNEIVENYTFIEPGKPGYEGRFYKNWRTPRRHWKKRTRGSEADWSKRRTSRRK